MKAVLHAGNHRLFITLHGRALDALATRRLAHDAALLEQASRAPEIVVDFSHVVIADCSGIALLVQLFQHQPPGGRLFVSHVNAAITSLLQDTMLDELFPVLDDEPNTETGEPGAARRKAEA